MGSGRDPTLLIDMEPMFKLGGDRSCLQSAGETLV